MDALFIYVMPMVRLIGWPTVGMTFVVCCFIALGGFLMAFHLLRRQWVLASLAFVVVLLGTCATMTEMVWYFTSGLQWANTQRVPANCPEPWIAPPHRVDL